MLTNLFSIFDPNTWIFSKYNLQLNWSSSIIPLILIPSMFWMSPSRWNMSYMILYKIILKEMNIIILKKMNLILFMNLFMMIFINNFMGLFPYIFTSSSHLNFTLTLALPLWLSMFLYGWMKNSNSMFIHLVPKNTPSLLMPFMVMIETISSIIRPMTLSIRLMANMISGHIILNLTSNSIKISYIFLTIQIILCLLELSVSMIQAYVFSILSILYSTESE